MNKISYHIENEILQKTEEILHHWSKNDIPKRFWDKDPYVFKQNPAEHKELADRLGWLTLPQTPKSRIDELKAFASEVKEKFSSVLLLGMGGSSLAPEVFYKTFSSKRGYPSFAIVDSTHPAVIKRIFDEYDLTKTLFIVASKSGGTAETSSFFYVFYEALKLKVSNPGSHFVALTDPGTSLEKLAVERGFLKVFNTPPEVGGRYSALTEFGLLPAALMGIDIEELLASAKKMQDVCLPIQQIHTNAGFYLGALLGVLSEAGKDKITFFASPAFRSFPQWVEQLIAESTGKEEKGILPVADDVFLSPKYYSDDRVTVFLRLAEESDFLAESIKQSLLSAGKNIIDIEITSLIDLAQEFYRWEMATAISGIVLGINPFDQPNVQLAKTLANESLAEYRKTGKLPEEKPFFSEGGIDVLTEIKGGSVKTIVHEFLKNTQQGDFVALLAFVPYSAETELALQELRRFITLKYGVTVTVGFGPRFLHSTGQLHKGGKNNGYFIQITDAITTDVEVPGQGYSFGTLITAQAQGDANALLNKQRKLLKLKINYNIFSAIRSIIS